jgi:hypothetical protein
MVIGTGVTVQLSSHTSLKPIFARLTKVDEETRTVTGRAAQEMVDRDNEMMDYDSSKPEFMKWSAEVSADTGGRSLGNVRAMHGNIAAGVLTDIRFEDAEKAVDISAHIVDDQEWKKIISGTYAGFSIGGRYSKRWSEPINGKMVTKYTAVPSEISIVDRPCIPTAKFFTIHKRDGSVVEKAFSFSPKIELVDGKIEFLQKGSDDQPRDDHGRFGSGGGNKASMAVKTRDGGLHVVHNVPTDRKGEGNTQHQLAANYLKGQGHDVVSSWMAEHTSSAMPSKTKAISEGRYTSHEYSEAKKSDGGGGLQKDFTEPTSATSGLQDYDLEGTGKKPKDLKATKGKKKVPRAGKQPATTAQDQQDDVGQPGEFQCEDEEGGSVSCDDEDQDDDNDGASQDGSSTDELSAKRAKKALSVDRVQDANADDATDTDPNKTGYGKRKFSDKQRASAADSGAAMPDGSFPIKSKQDLKNAIQAHGRAKDPDKAKAHIKGRAKALGATDMLPDAWKADGLAITRLDDAALAKFYAVHKATFDRQDLVKGVCDVASLGNLINQLKYLADGAALERQIEGDNSPAPEKLKAAAIELLSILSGMAQEESSEMKNGTTAEDVLSDQAPSGMMPGLYRHDIGDLAKAMRTSLGLDDLAKEGRRHSAKDLETLQKCHDALCELGATCAGSKGSPHDQDGNSVDPTAGVEKMTKQVNKADTITAEGDKRGAAVSDPSTAGQQSDNATDAEDTNAAAYGAEAKKAKKNKARMNAEAMKRKAQKDMDEDDDEDEDDDDDMDDMDEDDEDDEEEQAPPPKAKKKAKKVAKGFSVEDLAKAVAAGVAAALPTVLAQMNKGADVTIPRIPPNLMQVGKDGVVNKLQSVDIDQLRKSVAPVNGGKIDEGDNDTATLIKAIHKNGAFRLDPMEIPTH